MEAELREKHNEFRIGVKQTEEWKIKSIAAFKKKNIKQPAVAAVEEMNARKPVNETPHEVKSASQQQAKAASNEPSSTMSSSGTAVKVNSVPKPSSSSSTAPSVKPAPSEAALARQAEAALIQKQLQLEQALRELEHYSHNSQSAQERIRQLHQMRSSLLWLLKKAARHERLMVHEHLSSFAANNP